ncbi:MAG: response regulator, partial [Chloroflexi bacterium]|nr:response regulator [Chloroflexota bacterium]
MTTVVLLIDPDISFMVTIKQALESTGDFRISLAANGGAAESLLQDGGYDVIVAGFDLPDMDAMELIRRLRLVDPQLPIIVCPHTTVHYERVRLMDVQGAIAKPYTARDLILYVRNVLRKLKTPPPQPPPKPAAQDVLREFEALEATRPETRQPAEEKPSGNKTRLLPPDEPPVNETRPQDDTAKSSHTRALDRPQDPSKTRVLEPLEDPSKTRVFDDQSDQVDTSQLPDTDSLDGLMERHGWEARERRPQTKPLSPRVDEPPRQAGDTPAVPGQDLDSMRQFLATDRGAHDTYEFGEVLNAVAQSDPSAYDRPPDERAFHDLVDSMRPSATDRPRRPRLEELLASMASDMASSEPSDSTGSALDYVLDAIRRGTPPSTPGALSDADLDDTTIGEVIDGMFDPSFEGVLAALAGQEIGDDDYEEPTYDRTRDFVESVEPSPQDQFTLEEMSGDEDRPAWLEAYEVEGIAPAEMAPPSPPPLVPLIEEPPVSSEDSSHYPATAALTAATGADESSERVLDSLLAHIEQQLPPPRKLRPHLKPLPSWQKQSLSGPDQGMQSLFDHLEGVRSASPGGVELDEALSDHGPVAYEEPLLSTQDTRPSLVIREFQESVPRSTTPPSPAAEPDQEENDLRALADWEELPPGMLTIEELYALADLPAEVESESGTPFAESPNPLPDRPAALPEEQSEERSEKRSEERPEERPEELPEPEMRGGVIFPPDESHLIPLPADTAAMMMIQGGLTMKEAVADEEEAAQTAVMLTQYSLESSAQATMLTRPGKRLAQAGELPPAALDRLFQVVDHAWKTSSDDLSGPLVRFISLPDAGDFALYSAPLGSELYLSMVFNTDTPVRTIRRQARRLSESLEFVPEVSPDAAPPEPPAATTTPSRPTELRAPAGLHEAAAESMPVRPVPTEPYSAYTCLWLPFDPGQELRGNLADDLDEWIRDLARQRVWELHALDIHSDYVLLSFGVPQKTLPDSALTELMQETARLCAESYPSTVEVGPLWTDGYYLVAPS